MRATHRFLRPDTLLPFGLLIAGSLAFAGGGRLHPIISTSTLGAYGTEQFYRAFAHEMIHTSGWQQMHMLILVGPVLWALGAAAVVRLLPARVAAFGEVGRAALLLAAGAWALGFILDGFVGPQYARIIVATEPGSVTSVMQAFGISQLTMARLGMISIVLIGAGITAYSVALLAVRRWRSWGGAVSAIGVLVGLWPMIAGLQGEFSPGPFTSPYWSYTALSIALWMILFATALPATAEATISEAVEAGERPLTVKPTGTLDRSSEHRERAPA
jgi:hypothetical protein